MINNKFIKDTLSKRLTELDEKRIVGGVLIKCEKTGRIFLLLRNDPIPTWALVSGGIEKGEDVLEGLKREIHEELFINPNQIEFKFVGIEHFPTKNLEFHYYQGFTQNEFKPILDHENLNYLWCDKNHLPSPLFRGLSEKIAKI